MVLDCVLLTFVIQVLVRSLFRLFFEGFGSSFSCLAHGGRPPIVVVARGPPEANERRPQTCAEWQSPNVFLKFGVSNVDRFNAKWLAGLYFCGCLPCFNRLVS